MDKKQDSISSISSSWKRKLPVGWEALISFLIGLMAAFVNDKICFIVVAALSIALVVRHSESPASVVGLVFTFACQAPLLRRVHDLFHGFTPGSPILITSYIAYPVLGLIVFRNLPQFRKIVFLPMVIASLGVLWAYCVGVTEAGLVSASIQLLQYSAGPIIFGYVLINSKNFNLNVLFNWFLVLGTIEAIYGVYQWVSPPAWDVVWFDGAGMSSAGGRALPFMMRTFGTLNSVAPFAYLLFYLLVVSVGRPKYLLIAPIMIAGLATTQGRSTWGATFVGWAFILLLAKGKDRTRTFLSIAGTLGIVALIALPFSERLITMTERIMTIGNIKGDNSFRDRTALVDAFLAGGALDDPIGVGLGSSGAASRSSGKGISGIDNGFLQTLWVFGWFGSLFYLGGFITTLIIGITRSQHLTVTELSFLAAAVALFSANIFSSCFEDFTGVMIWLAVGIACRGSYRSQNESPAVS